MIAPKKLTPPILSCIANAQKLTVKMSLVNLGNSITEDRVPKTGNAFLKIADPIQSVTD